MENEEPAVEELLQKEIDLEERRLRLRERELALREAELAATTAQHVHEEKMKQLEHQHRLELSSQEIRKRPNAEVDYGCRPNPTPQRKRHVRSETLSDYTIIKPGWDKSNPKTQEEAMGILLDYCLIPSTQQVDTIEIDSVIYLVKQAALKNIMNWMIPAELFRKMSEKLQSMEERDFIQPILQAQTTFRKCQLLRDHKKGKFLDNDMVVKQRPSSHRSTCLTHIVLDQEAVERISTI
jgi:hypothetical protein